MEQPVIVLGGNYFFTLDQTTEQHLKHLSTFPTLYPTISLTWKFSADIHGSQRVNPTVSLVPLVPWSLNKLSPNVQYLVLSSSPSTEVTWSQPPLLRWHHSNTSTLCLHKLSGWSKSMNADQNSSQNPPSTFPRRMTTAPFSPLLPDQKPRSHLRPHHCICSFSATCLKQFKDHCTVWFVDS